MSFTATIARRERVPLLVGLCGPSSSGKTFSALRLASGIQREVGGKIFMIDTEARRSLHYADRFDFMHVEFGPPFGSLRYLEALQWAVKQGASVVVIDSMSHEHEGPGGYLDTQEAELQRLAGDDWRKRNSMNFLAWKKPAAERRALINGMLQLPCNFVFCFRAKEKLKIERGKDPVDLGWMPIAGPEFVFEMTLQALLLPGSGGVPTWRPEMPGERAMIKLPAQFRSLFSGDERPLDEDTGAALAAWARGSSQSAASPTQPAAATDGGGISPTPTPPPSSSFPGDAVKFGKQRFDPAQPATLPFFDDFNEDEWRAFGKALRTLIERAGDPATKHAWERANQGALLIMASKSPALRAWTLEPLPAGVAALSGEGASGFSGEATGAPSISHARS